MSQMISFEGARTFDAALDQLADETRSLGFDAVDYGFMPRARTQDGRYHSPAIVSRNFPQRWLRGWARFLNEDPLLYGAYPRTLPLDWRNIEDAGWLNPIQREAFGFIHELGFHDGVTVPIHLPGDAFAFVTVASRQRNGIWRARQKAVMDRLFLLAHSFHADQGGRGPVAGEISPERLLSVRERAVLALCAEGLNAPGIARRCDRSVETVRLQRKSAMRKLGAHTTTHAVARAVELGLI